MRQQFFLPKLILGTEQIITSTDVKMFDQR